MPEGFYQPRAAVGGGFHGSPEAGEPSFPSGHPAYPSSHPIFDQRGPSPQDGGGVRPSSRSPAEERDHHAVRWGACRIFLQCSPRCFLPNRRLAGGAYIG